MRARRLVGAVKTWLMSIGVTVAASLLWAAVPQLLNANSSLLTPYPADALNRLTGLTAQNAQSAVIADYGYTLGTAGHRLTATESVAAPGGAQTISRVYGYDAAHRLIGETLSVSGVPGLPASSAVSYTLDAVGNKRAQSPRRNCRATAILRPARSDGARSRTRRHSGNCYRLARSSTLPGVSSASDTYDANDRLTADTYDPKGQQKSAKPKALSPGDRDFEAVRTHGARSGIPRRSGNCYTLAGLGSERTTLNGVYDFEDRLISATTASGSSVSIVYDGDGHRVAKTVDGVTTLYLVDDRNPTGYVQVLEEYVAVGAQQPVLCRVYTYGIDLISQTQLLPDGNGGEVWVTHYFLYDGQGSVWGLADGSGALTDVYTYDAFGLHLREEGAGTPNNIRYTGEMWDADLGQYYLRARYYEPNRGRFWTMDSFEGFSADPISLHKYLYAGAEPVMFVDPSGNDFTSAEVSLTVAIISTVGLVKGLVNFQKSIESEAKMWMIQMDAVSSGIVVQDEDFYEPMNNIRNISKEKILSEAYQQYVWGNIFDCAGEMFEAARLLRRARNVGVAMENPEALLRYTKIMKRLGYQWLPNPNNAKVGGNWVRPAKMKNILPHPEKAYEAYNELVAKCGDS